MAATQQCSLSSGFGVKVQAVLALMVLVVLSAEYAHEYLCNHKKRRKLLQFWFDTYKICAGALISHIFNMGVSKIIGGASGTNECAVYALAFYYEACGVPFVQLLQYGVIHYATVMSKKDSPSSCQDNWKHVAQPGMYPDTPSTDNDQYGVWECCRDLDLHKPCSMLTVIIIAGLSAAAGFLIAYFALGQSAYISSSFGMLAAIFSGTLYLAPHSSHWQVVNWVIVKAFEKFLWSIVAIAQEQYFREWAKNMSTGNVQLDAWLFIAIIPIVMNAFMFFMFSRISRLKIPCMTVTHRGELDEMERRQSEAVALEVSNPTNPTQQEMHGLHGLSFQHDKFNIQEAIKVGVVYTIFINTVLYIIAVAYLESRVRSGLAAGILFITMIVFPVFASAIFIWFFHWMITSVPPVNICAWCCCCCCCGWYDTSKQPVRLGTYHRMDDAKLIE